ncbi:MAG: molybdopterin cofactor-binding domain-containing protein, partial [Steroidobacteraceae bacterium]
MKRPSFSQCVPVEQAPVAMAQTLSELPAISRRAFLKCAGVSGGGLALAFYVGDLDQAQAGQASSAFQPNAFVQISTDGSILIYSRTPEIGQGIKTAAAMIIAEELDADWQQVRVVQAPVNPTLYGNQSAGGSNSIPLSWDQLRPAGAMARAMLVSAAARAWHVAESECRTNNSTVICTDGRTQSYAALVTRAAALPVPDSKSLRFKQRSEYQLLGKRMAGVDNISIVTGQPLFGIDTVLPNMLYAVYEKCPASGGRVLSANLDAIKRLPGVRDAFVVEGLQLAIQVLPGIPLKVQSGVAIIAASTWEAFNARRQLEVIWDEESASKDSWDGFVAQAGQLAKVKGTETLHDVGNVDQAFGSASHPVEAFYSYPFAAHATLEPQNCTAWYRNGNIEVWAPSQLPSGCLKDLAELLAIPIQRVTVHQTRVGGGFGRRLFNDYVYEAALIAKEFAKRSDAPIKLTWNREDDTANDLFRPGGFHAFKGAVDKQGKVSAWQHHFISFTTNGSKPVTSGDLGPDELVVPCELLPNVRITQSLLKSATPTGPLRGPRSNAVAFATQCFLHELAVAGGRDHVEFLLELLGQPRWLEPGNMRVLNTARAAAVIKLVAEQAGWGKRLPKGRGLGLAFHFSHSGHVAEVADVSVDSNNKLTLHQVTVAADVGQIVNLSGAEAQVEGSVIDGFSVM